MLWFKLNYTYYLKYFPAIMYILRSVISIHLSFGPIVMSIILNRNGGGDCNNDLFLPHGADLWRGLRTADLITNHNQMQTSICNFISS